MFNRHTPTVIDPNYKTLQANIYKKGFKHPFIVRFSFPKEKEADALAWVREVISFSERKSRKRKKVSRPIVEVIDGKLAESFLETGTPPISMDEIKRQIRFDRHKNLHLHVS